MSFDLKDYITVQQRMAEFYKKYPEGSLQLDPPQITSVEGKTWAIGRAYAYRSPDDMKPGIGTAWEIVPGLTPYTRGSEMQNLETSCWGRALAAIGIGIDKGVATADEVRAAQHREGAWTKSSEPDSDTRFMTGFEQAISHPGNLARKINDKQVGLLRGKLRGKGIEGDAIMPFINAALEAAGKDSVHLPKEMDNSALNIVLEAIEQAQSVDEYLSG